MFLNKIGDFTAVESVTAKAHSNHYLRINLVLLQRVVSTRRDGYIPPYEYKTADVLYVDSYYLK